MGHGNQITPPIPPPIGGKPLTGAADDRARQQPPPATDRPSSNGGDNSPQQARENAPPLLDRRWQNSQAENRRNNLLAQFAPHGGGRGRNSSQSSGNSQGAGRGNGHGRTDNFNPLSNSRNGHGDSVRQHAANVNRSLREFSSRLQNSADRMARGLENSARQNVNHAGRNFSEGGNRWTGDNSRGVARQTLESLFAAARSHKDFQDFRHQPREFWDRVRDLSAVRVVETFVKGNFEPRAVSRYGELLDRLNRQAGGRLDRFLSWLPPGERDVFAARYQMERSFGANRFFVGGGVNINERGEFFLREFLANNGRNLRLSPSTIFGILGGAQHASKQGASAGWYPAQGGSPWSAGATAAGEMALFQNASLFSGGGGWLNSASSALLGAALALYQNADAWLPLETLAARILAGQNTAEQLARRPLAVSQNTFETASGGDAAVQQGNEEAAVAALINGALASVEKYRKSAYEGVGLWTDNEAEGPRFRFSAGATGAIMSATIGCVAPLAGESAAEALGFAAGIVNGLNDGGLRSLGTSAIVSVVTANVQIVLDASNANRQALHESPPARLLGEAESYGFFEDDLGQGFFDRRINSFVTS